MSKYTYVSENARQRGSAFSTGTFDGISQWDTVESGGEERFSAAIPLAKHTEVKIMESFKNTQERRILSYMEEYGSITQTEAFFDLGVMRLASRISSLRKQGYKIESTLEKVKNRYGESCRIKRYRLSDDARSKECNTDKKTDIPVGMGK